MQEQLTTPRKNRTKDHLQLALIALIKEKGFRSVTVKDIVEYANYNRSTFYIHYQDKYELAEDLLDTYLQGLEQSIELSYQTKQRITTDKLGKDSFNIITYIYDHRSFFELINFSDTIPELHTRFPQTILKIYQEKVQFKTINNIAVNMDYFKRYTAYGFYGLISNWIQTEFEITADAFIEEVIQLSKTHIAAVRYLG